VNWFIEGDISSCFDNFDHVLLLKLLNNKIKDDLFFQTMYKLLKAGYIYKGSITKQLKGVPQGSILSPILSNIYLTVLDNGMSFVKSKFDIGNSIKRKFNPIYLKALKVNNNKLLLKINPYIDKDELWRRVWYVRYADDFLVGIIGSKNDVNFIKELISIILKDIKLELNEEKMLITHATTNKAHFLGYYIGITSNKRKPIKKVYRNNKSFYTRINTRPQLLVPIPRLIKKLKENNFAKQKK